MIKVIHLRLQRKRSTYGYPRLTPPGISMKRTTNVKSTPAPGFSTKSTSWSGKQSLGFFGLKEKVSFSMSYGNLRVKQLHSGMWQKHSIVSPHFQAILSKTDKPSFQFFDYPETLRGK